MKNKTPFHIAAMNDSRDLLIELILKGVDIKGILQRDDYNDWEEEG